MGAATFYTEAKGRTAVEAFRHARERALWNNGHGGYTGTIAEKHDFTMIACPPGETPRDHADALIDAGDPRVSTKRGPASCIDCGDGTFAFFGWAAY